LLVSASLHGAGRNGGAGEVTEQLISSSSTMYLISPLSRQTPKEVMSLQMHQTKEPLKNDTGYIS